ncbi:hypothetical protein [Ulvibacterium sp.]|uniref:hypothetical protein n=1 Tax=Ulvibacterium sp. TaxID=2665914 RepID=UPI003BA8CDD9
MKQLLKPFVLSFIVLFSCTEDEERQRVEDLSIIQSILEKGITVDSIALDYATMYRGAYGFPAIETIQIEKFIDEDEILVYYDFISHSRDSLYRYIENRDREHHEQGIVVDYAIKYNDKLESIIVEVKKNNAEFIEFTDNSEDITLIPTPEINSQDTFAKYEFTIEEFTERYQNSRFPEFCVLSFDKKEEVSNTYAFRVTFKFNNQKEFALNTSPIEF